jgi:glycosyltransferase involved in cell wall biosynthesis
MLPLVTIVTPSYQQCAFLEKTMRSVLDQDYPHLEYIVVDGGSTDGSVDIIRKYADRLAWWISEKDNGQAEAINKGLMRAQGEIVAWLNSDDLYMPGAISRAVETMHTNQALGLIYGDAVTIDANGVPLNVLSFGDWGWKDLIGFRIICQPAVFMRRSVLERAGFLDEEYHFMLDHHLWLRIASLAPIQHIPEILAAARHHADAKNVSQSEGFAQETEHTMQWLRQKNIGQIGLRSWHFIEGGAYRLQGRYYLDSGKPLKALAAYGRALWRRPAYTLQHLHRILYAILSLMGLQGLLDILQRSRADEARQNAEKLVKEQMMKVNCSTWIGIKL